MLRLAGARLAILAVAAAMVLGGCAGPGGFRLPPGLQGRLVTAPEGAPVSHEAFFARAAAADVVYLGEQHGNPFHHASQLEIVSRLVAMGKRPVIAFESVTLPQTSDVMNFVSRASFYGGTIDPLERLQEAIGWSDDDERWRQYGPMIEFARANGLTVAGIDLPRALRQRITRVGVSGLNAVERLQLHDSGFADPEYEALMHERLNAGHCGHAPASLLGRLYETWLARNDAMAASIAALAEANRSHPVVVITGWGHVANNMGVYERVAARAPGIRQLNVGFRAAMPGQAVETELQPLRRGERGFAPSHELLWITPANPHAKPDPCAGVAQRMQAIDQ